MIETTIASRRVVWLDILRVFSAFTIVFLHISAAYLENVVPLGSVNWFITDLYLAFTRFAVPVFVMISGVFFLNPQKDLTIGQMYKHYIFRILTVLLGWALFRTLLMNVWLGHAPVSAWAPDVFTSIKWYWFLPMIIGLYMMTPVLRALSALNNRKVLAYFIVLSFVMALCLPMLENVERFYWPMAIRPSAFTDILKIPCLVFGAHFVFGYYAYTYDIGFRMKKVLYASAVVSWLLMAGGGYVFWNEKANPLYFYFMFGASLAPFSFLTGAAVFLLAKDWLGKISFSPAAASFMRRLAYYSLGVYMLHIILVELGIHFGVFKALSFCPAILVPVLAVVLFMLCNGIIAVLYKILWFRKYFL